MVRRVDLVEELLVGLAVDHAGRGRDLRRRVDGGRLAGAHHFGDP